MPQEPEGWQRFDELIDGLTKGDVAAAEPLLREFGPAVREYLKRRYRLQAADIEEILQETLFNLWRGNQTYDRSKRSKNSPLNWVHAIARNAANDWFRKNSNHLNDTVLTFDPPARGPQEDTIATLEIQALEKILCRLDGDERLIVIERAMTPPLPFSELAKRLGKSVGAVRTQHHRLLKTIENDMHARGFFLSAPLTINS